MRPADVVGHLSNVEGCVLEHGVRATAVGGYMRCPAHCKRELLGNAAESLHRRMRIILLILPEFYCSRNAELLPEPHAQYLYFDVITYAGKI